MSLTKQEVAPSDYIQTGAKAPSKGVGRTTVLSAYKKAVNERSTIYTLCLLAGKHKIGLLAIGNIILVLNWAFPAWPELLKSLI